MENQIVEPTPAQIRDYQDNIGVDCLSKDDIATLAYELWEQHGNDTGSPVQYWLEAERILRERAGQTVK